MLLYLQKRLTFRKPRISYLSVAPTDARVLTVLLTTWDGATCDSMVTEFGLIQDEILAMNPTISYKCPRLIQLFLESGLRDAPTYSH